MGGQENCSPFLAAHFDYILPYAVARLWVQPQRRLVKEQHPGAVQQPPGQLKAALHTAGIGLGKAVAPVPQFYHAQHLLDALLAHR